MKLKQDPAKDCNNNPELHAGEAMISGKAHKWLVSSSAMRMQVDVAQTKESSHVLQIIARVDVQLPVI